MADDDTQQPVDEEAAASEEAPEEEADKAAGIDCDKCKGSGQFEEAECEKCGGSGKLAYSAKAADGEGEASEPPAGDGTEGDADPESDEDEEKHRKSARKAAKKAATATALKLVGDDVPWAVRRAHDASCPAYGTKALIAEYPSLEKNGLGSALGSGARTALFSMLAGAIANDGGEGTGAPAVVKLAGAYASLGDLLGDQPATEAYLAARDELHAAFKSANAAVLGDGDGPAIPKPTDTPKPGEFQRPYLAAGHAAQTASAHSADVTAPPYPVSASDFQRGPLGPAQGQQRSFADKLMAFHDAVAFARPELCRMVLDVPDPAGWYGGTGHVEPSTMAIANRAGSKPTSTTVPDGPAVPGAKGAMPDVPVVTPPSEAVIKAVTEDELAAAVTKSVTAEVAKATQPLLDEITTLRAQITELGDQPDSAQRAVRGVAGIAKLATPDAAKARREARQQGKRDRKAEFHRGMVASGNPDQRQRSSDWLSRHGLSAEAS